MLVTRPDLRPRRSSRHRAKKLATYSPYNVAMRKIEGNVEARQVIAPKSGIKTENTNKGHMNSRRHTMAPKGKQVAAATSRIPVSRAVWAELSSLRKPGQTYDLDCTPDCRQLVKQQYLRQPPFRTALEIYNQVMNAASSSCTHSQ